MQRGTFVRPRIRRGSPPGVTGGKLSSGGSAESGNTPGAQRHGTREETGLTYKIPTRQQGLFRTRPGRHDRLSFLLAAQLRPGPNLRIQSYLIWWRFSIARNAVTLAFLTVPPPTTTT